MFVLSTNANLVVIVTKSVIDQTPLGYMVK